ncbi:MAG TPA: DUF4012 domain-containing protein [Ktedonobacterales bacterium]|nr:DUF4012 domain-containing protein [Ktedonobacterales bacterium]
MSVSIRGKVRSGLNWLSFKHLSKKRRRIAHAALVVLVLTFILTPVALAGSSAYQVYENIRQLGYDGVNHVLAVKDLFLKPTTPTSGCATNSSPTASATTAPTASTTPGASSTPTTSSILPGSASLNSINLKALTDKATLNKAYADFMTAKSDFVQLQNELNNHPMLLSLAGLIPSYSNQVTEAKMIAKAGIDIGTLGAEVTTTALTIVGRLPDNPLSAGNTPLFTNDEVPLIQTTINDADHLLGDLQTQLSGLDLNSLPVSACQRATFSKAIAQLPEAHHLLDQVNTLLPVGIWALGIDKPRNFLVQTLDRAELRGSGGFSGQYGVVTINGGRIGSLSLQDIAWLDYCGTGTCSALGNSAPAKWSWWPFGNFGLRDSNISADYPTTAQEAIKLFEQEGGGKVDGVISLTPIPIEHILAITGPIFVPGYNETITSTNLEDRIHYYQQDPAGIAKEKQISAGNTSITARKRFTSLVGSLLQQRLRQLPFSQLMLVAKQVLADMQSKDLEVYLSNPQAEALLTKYSLDSSIDRSTSTDTWMVVQSNISVNKATQYVNTTETDVVNLDASGGATHHLTITLDYNKQGDVYGYPTYRDYVRVYAPAGSQLISGYGFDSGSPMCLPAPPASFQAPKPPAHPKPSKYAKLPDCSYYDPYPGGGLACPAGGWATGQPYTFDYMDSSDEKTPWPIDYLAGPTNTTSDEPGLAMWGGLVLVPPYCTAYITLTWYTPKVAAPGKTVKAGQSPYSLLVQRQSGTFNALDVTIIPASKAAGVQGKQQVKFKGSLNANQLITLPPIT